MTAVHYKLSAIAVGRRMVSISPGFEVFWFDIRSFHKAREFIGVWIADALELLG